MRAGTEFQILCLSTASYFTRTQPKKCVIDILRSNPNQVLRFLAFQPTCIN